MHADILGLEATVDRPVRQLRVIDGRFFRRGQVDTVVGQRPARSGWRPDFRTESATVPRPTRASYDSDGIVAELRPNWPAIGIGFALDLRR